MMDRQIIVCIGYTAVEDQGYQVSIEVARLEHKMLSSSQILNEVPCEEIDGLIANASNQITGNVLCHSIYELDGKLYVAFLIHQ